MGTFMVSSIHQVKVCKRHIRKTKIQPVIFSLTCVFKPVSYNHVNNMIYDEMFMFTSENHVNTMNIDVFTACIRHHR